MNLLHLQQFRVVAHTTHNRLRPDLSPDLTPSPPTYITQPNPINPTQPHPTHHPIHLTTQTFHPSNYLSTHTHLHTDAYTLTRSIVNKLLTLYIPIDILTFMWYNQDNGEGAFLYVKYLTMQC